ncbi:MAG: preprotein translocase subunit SecY [bacterium]
MKGADIWAIPDLRRRLTVVIICFAIFAFGIHVPLPGINREYLKTISSSGVFGLFNMFSGGALERFSIFSLGVIPYINASIMMQLLTFSIEPLKEMVKERGEEGRRVLARWTRYIAVFLAFFEGIGLIKAIESGGGPQSGSLFVQSGWFPYFVVLISITAGTCYLMWLGEQISNKGIGEGISLVIFAGILISLPQRIGQELGIVSKDPSKIAFLVLYVAALFAMLLFIVYVEMAERRIPVRYARKQVGGRMMVASMTSYLPMKVNIGGVIPIIFAITFLMIPQLLAGFFANAFPGFVQWAATFNEGWGYLLALMLLTLLSNHFYSAVIYKPDEIADNLKNMGGFIPGVRPGDQTTEYISRIQEKVTWMGGIYLALLGTAPFILAQLFFGTSNRILFTGTGLLIVVGVGLDFVRQLEAHVVSRHYEGFIK